MLVCHSGWCVVYIIGIRKYIIVCNYSVKQHQFVWMNIGISDLSVSINNDFVSNRHVWLVNIYWKFSMKPSSHYFLTKYNFFNPKYSVQHMEYCNMLLAKLPNNSENRIAHLIILSIVYDEFFFSSNNHIPNSIGLFSLFWVIFINQNSWIMKKSEKKITTTTKMNRLQFTKCNLSKFTTDVIVVKCGVCYHGSNMKYIHFFRHLSLFWQKMK